MQKHLFIGTLALVTGGCAAFHHLDEYTTAGGAETSTPGTEDVPGGSVPSAPGTSTPTAKPLCASNRACTEAASVGRLSPVAAVCVKATGACAELTTPACPRVTGDYLNDAAIVVGAIEAEDGDGDDAIARAAVLAADELHGSASAIVPVSSGKGPRPLVVLGCKRTDAVAAAKHLVGDLRVPAIVGPNTGEDVVAVTQQVSAKGGTLLMTPKALTSTISNLADDGLTWRIVPSDAQRAKLVIEEVNALESLLASTRGLTTVKLGIVHPTNALGTSAYGAVSGKLIVNGRFLSDPQNAANVSIDPHAPGDGAAAASIAAKYAGTFRPDIVFVTAAEQITSFIVPLEDALTAARVVNRPYYVLTEAAKTDALLGAIGTSLPADIRRRIRGVGVRPDAASAEVTSAFSAAYAARYGQAPGGSVLPAAALAYDATYAITYAIAAAGDDVPTGASVAKGLRALGVGDAKPVGPASIASVMAALTAHTPVSLRGTFSQLLWDESGDIAAGTAEVWCVGTSGGATAFGSSGLTMDVATQVVGGSFLQCQ